MKKAIDNIILTGFRATGKTTVGRLIARRLGWAFLDTDALLCQRLGAPIAEVVARRGWSIFREAEGKLLQELCSMRQTVLATGGGAIEHREAWRELSRCGVVVWLDADLATIGQRLQGDPQSDRQRPSITGRAIIEEVEELLTRRRPLYAAGSDLRLMVTGKTPDQLVDAIVQAVLGNQSSGATGEDEPCGPTHQGNT